MSWFHIEGNNYERGYDEQNCDYHQARCIIWWTADGFCHMLSRPWMHSYMGLSHYDTQAHCTNTLSLKSPVVRNLSLSYLNTDFLYPIYCCFTLYNDCSINSIWECVVLILLWHRHPWDFCLNCSDKYVKKQRALSTIPCSCGIYVKAIHMSLTHPQVSLNALLNESCIFFLISSATHVKALQYVGLMLLQPQNFTHTWWYHYLWQKIQYYKVRMASSDIMFFQNFMKICHLVQKLQVGDMVIWVYSPYNMR
jgi:hypothetical protein